MGALVDLENQKLKGLCLYCYLVPTPLSAVDRHSSGAKVPNHILLMHTVAIQFAI